MGAGVGEAAVGGGRATGADVTGGEVGCEVVGGGGVVGSIGPEQPAFGATTMLTS